MGGQLYTLWGDSEKEYDMSKPLLTYIRRKVGLGEDKIIWSGYRNIDPLPASSELKEILYSCISPDNVAFDERDRLRHSVGRGGLDYIRLMEMQPIKTVDAVVYPVEEEIKCLLGKAGDQIEIIPFGGGTSVTGGITPTGRKKFSVSLDLSKLDYLMIDRSNNVLEAGSGVKGPKIEEELEKYGLTLGNFPESFHFSTLGGWIGTNAAGQESNRYGKVKEMVLGVRMEAPTGTYQDRIVPGESAFFKLSDLAVGSEGSFGIVTRAWVKVQRKPKQLFYRAQMFESFREGLEALRKKFTEGEMPIITRLSDEDETELSMMGIKDTFINNAFKKYVAIRMHNQRGSILIAVSDRKEEIGFESSISLGSLPAKYWNKERYSRPLMYNELLKRGIVAETIETSAEWSGLDEIHNSTRKRFSEILETLGIKGMILCHSSHQYVTGSALYFTFLFYSQDNREAILNQVRDGIMENILAKGGSISHHHGIGNLQSKYLREYKGSMYDLTKTIKSYFDPKNSLVPGILDKK